MRGLEGTTLWSSNVVFVCGRYSETRNWKEANNTHRRWQSIARHQQTIDTFAATFESTAKYVRGEANWSLELITTVLRTSCAKVSSSSEQRVALSFKELFYGLSVAEGIVSIAILDASDLTVPCGNPYLIIDVFLTLT